MVTLTAMVGGGNVRLTELEVGVVRTDVVTGAE